MSEEIREDIMEEVKVKETPAVEVPSMEEFKEEINKSFKNISEGDMIKGTVIGVSETEVMVDLGYYTEGIIKLEELSNDPRFSIKSDILPGDEVQALVLREDDGHGSMLLSLKRAQDIIAWDKLRNDLENKTIRSVKLAQAVKGGLITYLEGIRAFIPASQLSLSYVENLEDWVNKTIEAIVITVEEENKKLILSGKEVEREKAIEDKKSKISKLQKGLVTTGVVEKIMPFGCFVNIGDGLSGLVHISQICGRHIKSPNEVVKEGEEVKVKVLDIKDGKISLSIKAVEEREEVLEDVGEAIAEFQSGEEAATGLAALLSGIKLS